MGFGPSTTNMKYLFCQEVQHLYIQLYKTTYRHFYERNNYFWVYGLFTKKLFEVQYVILLYNICNLELDRTIVLDQLFFE